MTMTGYAIAQGFAPTLPQFKLPNLRWATSPDKSTRALARILVSDDNPGIQQIYTYILPRHGFEVVTTPGGNGYATVELCHEYQPDLVITDINKPGLNGHQIVQVMHASNDIAHIPVLLVTAMDEWLERRRGYVLDADDYIVKPFLFESLLYRVVTLLGLNREAQERMVALTLGVHGIEYHHPVTGMPGPHALARALPDLSADPSWAMLTFGINGFERVIRARGRMAADDLLLRLTLIIRAALGGEAADVTMAHPGYDTRISVLGPAATLENLATRVHERFTKELQRRFGEGTSTLLPQLRIHRLDAASGPIHDLRGLWNAMDRTPPLA